MDDNRGLSYFLLGLGVGVAMGMIFAPQAGAETRGLLRNKASEGGDYIRRRTGDLRDSAADIVDRGKTVIGRQREQLGAAVEAGRQAYREAVSEATPPSATPGNQAL